MSLIPISMIQFIAFLIASIASASFIYRNLIPALQTTASMRPKKALIFVGILLLIHVIFIMSVRSSFFRHVHLPVPPASTPIPIKA